MAVDFHHEHLESLTNDKDSDPSIAKMRWKMLARALQEGRVQDSLAFPGSKRQFSSFGLIHMSPTDDVQNDNARDKWYQCSCLEEPRLKLKIKLFNSQIATEELKGFDNTGNVCIWPSEEVLTYYCMKNKELFGGNSVCELGGGMACLSGLAIAATAGAKEVIVTDGNIRCVENVQCIIQQNRQYFGATHVDCRHLRWDVDDDMTDLKSRFDVVICSDCVYYDDGRQALAETIWKILKDDCNKGVIPLIRKQNNSVAESPNNYEFTNAQNEIPQGVAVILAPTRGKSFQCFVDMVDKDFMVERLMAYDTHVWELHCRLKESKTTCYDVDSHYPQMLILRKF